MAEAPQPGPEPLPPYPGRPSVARPDQKQRFGIALVLGACALTVIFAVVLTTAVNRRRVARARTAALPVPDTSYQVARLVVRPGEVLPALLGRSGHSSAEVGRVVTALRDAGFNFRAMRPGDSVIVLRRDAVLRRLLYRRDFEHVYQVDVDSAACRVSMLVRRLERRPAIVLGTIQSSLYEALTALGEKPDIIADYADIFGWEVDFFSEVQPGDSFLIAFERKYADTAFVGYGSILAARYSGQVGTFDAYRFTDADGHTDYYNDAGQSLRKTFLKTPLRFSRVSSFFGRRRHPIRRVMRQHYGVDYVAPKGTPVDCVADGRVISAGWSGGYGRLVVVGHADGYETRYGHLSGFGKGIRSGTAVTQGQVIGYVGSTGLSTGPHLHYEVRKNGSATNPLRLNPPRAAPVRLACQRRFASCRDSLQLALARLTAPPQQPPARTPR